MRFLEKIIDSDLASFPLTFPLKFCAHHDGIFSICMRQIYGGHSRSPKLLADLPLHWQKYIYFKSVILIHKAVKYNFNLTRF